MNKKIQANLWTLFITGIIGAMIFKLLEFSFNTSSSVINWFVLLFMVVITFAVSFVVVTTGVDAKVGMLIVTPAWVVIKTAWNLISRVMSSTTLPASYWVVSFAEAFVIALPIAYAIRVMKFNEKNWKTKVGAMVAIIVVAIVVELILL